MKLQTKITLLFFAIGTIGLLLLNISIFYFVSEFNFQDFFKRLEARVNIAADVNVRKDEKSSTYKELRTKYLEKLEDEKEYIIKLDTTKGFRHNRPSEIPEQFYNAIIRQGKAAYNEENHFYFGAYFKTETGSYIVIVSASDPYGFNELKTLKRVLIFVFVISIVLTYFAGRIFSYYTVNPLRSIIKRVKNISANNLHSRLKELKGKDEMAELVLTFNNMLNRLETAFATQNNFVSNASHELKTPLTIITGEVELLLQQPDLSPATKKSAQVILSRSEQLAHILTSLLGLAQSGFDGKKQNWQRIRIDELILQVADTVKKIDANSVIEIDFSSLPPDESQLYTEGNINLLQLAISNIVLNACKYSNNRPVRIEVITEQQRIVIIVADKGIGIPEKEQQYVFEPFFRASNTSDFQGHGVGLPLTLNIIRLHKGSIGISSEEQKGTEMRIILPIYT